MLLLMRMGFLLVTLLFLAACGTPSSGKNESQQSDLQPGEKMALFPVEPYQWRNDPDCYISRSALASLRGTWPRPEALKWQKSRRYSGFLDATFEGSTFVVAKRNEKPDGLGEGRYQAQIYHHDLRVNFGFPYRTYWVVFIGREALCNSQRPGDAKFSLPTSPNLVIADRFEAVVRVH